jgi:predicted protein tyrosine phosphatase
MPTDEQQKLREFKRVLRLDIFDEYRNQLQSLRNVLEAPIKDFLQRNNPQSKTSLTASP